MGVGLVINLESDMLTVRFGEHGDKRFLYPDAFETYLKACDDDLGVAVAQDLNRKKAEMDAEHKRRQQLYDEEVRRQAEEKTHAAALKRKSAAKAKRSTANPQVAAVAVAADQA